MFKIIREDIRAILERDPAARNVLDVIFCYPGFHAILIHRLAHFLYKKRIVFFSRLLSYINRFITGVDVHPAAKIGNRVFIDHGLGVVIGESVEIGDNVIIYQGVTLGGTGKDTGKRHPTIGNNVIISSGAKVLGPLKVGDNCKIGAGAVLLNDIPPNCTVVGVPARIVKRDNYQIYRVRNEIDLDQGRLTNPIQKQIEELTESIKCIEKKLVELEAKIMGEAV